VADVLQVENISIDPSHPAQCRLHCPEHVLVRDLDHTDEGDVHALVLFVLHSDYLVAEEGEQEHLLFTLMERPLIILQIEPVTSSKVDVRRWGRVCAQVNLEDQASSDSWHYEVFVDIFYLGELRHVSELIGLPHILGGAVKTWPYSNRADFVLVQVNEVRVDPAEQRFRAIEVSDLF